MPMFTTTPIRIMKPIIAIIVIVVPVSARNQIEPTIANRIEVMIDSGYSADSNSEAITRKISTTASSMFCAMVCTALSFSSKPRPNFQRVARRAAGSRS